MDADTLGRFSHTLQTLAIAALAFAVCAYLPKLRYKSQLAKLPTFGTSSGEKGRQMYLNYAKRMYAEGYTKFKDTVYRMATENGDERIVVPPNLLPELRKLGDDVLSSPKALDIIVEAKYTKLTTDAPLPIHSIRSDLTPALSRLNPLICEEADNSLRDLMPPCKDWTEVCIYQVLTDVVAKMSGRVFVGADLCNDPEYLDAATNYSLEMGNAMTALKNIRPWLKPFLGHRIPEVRALAERERIATEFLKPVVQQRLDSKKNDPTWQESDDMLQWMLNRSKGQHSVAELAKLQLGLIFAAIHTTTLTATNVLYTLAVTPEYMDPLREEIRNVMADNDGIMNSRALQQMEKLDSYMKEVQRLYPPGSTTFSRRVLKGITFSNGQYLPPGAIVEVPSAAIHADSKYYPDADNFDGFRYARLRRSGSSTDHARNQFVTTNETNLAFGYGRHACPGRFFAANEIKMILARLILNYDIKMPGDATERYKQIEVGTIVIPFNDKMVMFKKVEV